ncbi:hypothetical protein HK405_008376, partial [Cladochytrium tenue]
ASLLASAFPRGADWSSYSGSSRIKAFDSSFFSSLTPRVCLLFFIFLPASALGGYKYRFVRYATPTPTPTSFHGTSPTPGTWESRRPEYTQLVCHASLWSSDGSEERGLVARSSPAASVAGARVSDGGGGVGASQPVQAGDPDDVQPVFVTPSSAAATSAAATAERAGAAAAAAVAATDTEPGRQPAGVSDSAAAGRPNELAPPLPPPPRKSSDPTSTGAATFFSSSSAFHAVVARQRPPPPPPLATPATVASTTGSVPLGQVPHALADGLPLQPPGGAAAAPLSTSSSLLSASSTPAAATVFTATFSSASSSSSTSSSSASTSAAGTQQDSGAMSSPPRLFHTLVGSTAVPALLLEDPDGGGEGVFFVFSDLSVRVKGIYRLKFHVVDVGTKVRASAAVTAWSDPFEVFPPKVFPGMMPSTILSRAFANQGLAIHVRMSRPDAVSATATPSSAGGAPASAGRAGSARPAGSSTRRSDGSPAPMLVGDTLPSPTAGSTAGGAKDVVVVGSAAAAISSSSSATRRPLSAVNEPGAPRGSVRRRPSDLGGSPR